MIRPAQESDNVALVELCRQLGYDLPPAELLANLTVVLSDPRQVILVAEMGGHVVGMISVLEQSSITESRYGLITAVVVDEGNRGKGVGRELLQAVEGWCKERSLNRMRLRANVIRIGAHRFYQHYGFTPKKEQRVFERLLTSTSEPPNPYQ